MSFNGVLKSWGDLWIPPGGALRCCCEVWSQSYSAATKLCIHKLWCLETRQGIEIIKVVMLSKQNLSMYHQLESRNKEGKKKSLFGFYISEGIFSSCALLYPENLKINSQKWKQTVVYLFKEVIQRYLWGKKCVKQLSIFCHSAV